MFGGGFGGFGGFPGFGGRDHDEDDTPKEVNNTKFYEILGLEKNASESEIKKAYRVRLVKGDYRHPDKGGDQEKFKQLQEAYDTLMDPEKKEIYDKYGEDGLKRESQGGGGGDPFDIIGQMFGGGRGGQREQGQRKAKPKLKELEVTLEEVYKGKMVKFDHKRQRNCETCEGKGGANVKKCGTCKGKRFVVKMVQLGPGMYSQSQAPCSECKGEGEIMDPKDKCKVCKGEKVAQATKTIEVGLEAGVPDGHDYVYTGESDEAPGIMAGDLHVRIKIKPHKVFTRKGTDLYIEKKISLLQALTGFNFEITHLDGQKFTIASVPGEVISHGEVKTIKGKGMPYYKDSFSHGHLFVKFNVEFPKRGALNAKQIEELQKILPGQKSAPLDKSKPFEYMDDFNESDANSHAEGGRTHGHDDDDDEEGHHGQGQRVQCSQQ